MSHLYVLKDMKPLRSLDAIEMIAIFTDTTTTKRIRQSSVSILAYSTVVCVCVCRTTFWLTKFLVRIFFNLQHQCIIYMSIRIFHVRPNYNLLFLPHQQKIFIQNETKNKHTDRVAASAIEFQIPFFFILIPIFGIYLFLSRWVWIFFL